MCWRLPCYIIVTKVERWPAEDESMLVRSRQPTRTVRFDTAQHAVQIKHWRHCKITKPKCHCHHEKRKPMAETCSQKPKETRVQFLSGSTKPLQPGWWGRSGRGGGEGRESIHNAEDDNDDVNHFHAIDIAAGEERYRGDSNTPTQEDKNLSSVILKILKKLRTLYPC